MTDADVPSLKLPDKAYRTILPKGSTVTVGEEPSQERPSARRLLDFPED